MSYGTFGTTSNTFADGAVGGVTPATRSSLVESVGNIMCFPFRDDLLDTTGNHTIDSGGFTLETQDPVSAPNNYYSYDPYNMLVVDQVASNNSRILASTQAHQIPHASPVSFGFFVMFRTWDTSTAKLLISGSAVNVSNYGIQRNPTLGWHFQGSALTTMGDQRNKTPTGRWTHIAMTVTANRSSGPTGTFYINGTAVWTGVVNNAAAVSSTDDFSFAADSSDITSQWNGFLANVFVTDTLLNAATIRALSDECHGHASPYTPGI